MKKIIQDHKQLDEPFELKEEHILVNPYLAYLWSDKYQKACEEGFQKLEEQQQISITENKSVNYYKRYK